MKAARVSTSLLGNQVAEPVYSSCGNLLLNKGTVIDTKILTKLINHDVDTVFILDSLSEGIAHIGLIDDQKMEESIHAVQKVFEHVMQHEKMGVRSMVPDEHIMLVQQILEEIMKELEQSEDILYTISGMIEADTYTYRHSVNVAILSILTAKSMSYKRPDIKNIAMGALLHDIGKMRVNQEILTKPDKLTLEERRHMERHPELGYEIVRDLDILPFTAKQIIQLHHEKLDGSGYPLGLKGIEIPEYVQLVTVCDMYDAMTTDRVYRTKMPIYRALEILMTDSVFKINPDIYRILTSNISIYPPGSGVILSDGRIGIVKSCRKTNPTRPRVRVLDLNASALSFEVEEVNLEMEQTLFVKDVWDVDRLKDGLREPSAFPQAPRYSDELEQEQAEKRSELKEVFQEEKVGVS